MEGGPGRGGGGPIGIILEYLQYVFAISWLIYRGQCVRFKLN